MARIKSKLRGLKTGERIEKSQLHLTELTDNPNFPNASVWLPPYQAAHDELKAALTDAVIKRAAYRAAVLRVRAAIKRWDNEHHFLVSRVEIESGGDSLTMVSGGFQLRDRRSVAHQLSAPQSLAATFGDREGYVDLAWDPLPGARGYIIQFATDLANGGNWQQALISTKSSCTVKGLVSGTNYWFRVAGLNSAGEGVFSGPVPKMSP